MFFKIINTIKFILNSKWIFDQPLKKKIVIYDYLNSYYLSKYLKKNSYVVVGCRREELYFWHFFNGLFTKYLTWNYFDHYLIPLLQKINPNYIITFLDNDPKVYKIKKFLPNTKIIVIQNGMRGYKKDFFSQIQDTKNLKADFVFTFNKHIADIYKKFITCKFYTIGSFKNNFYSIKKNFNKKQLVFISEYKPQGMFNSLLEYNNFCIKLSGMFTYGRVQLSSIFTTYDNQESDHSAQKPHFDRIPTLKFMLYLNDLKFENGAFCL